MAIEVFPPIAAETPTPQACEVIVGVRIAATDTAFVLSADPMVRSVIDAATWLETRLTASLAEIEISTPVVLGPA